MGVGEEAERWRGSLREWRVCCFSAPSCRVVLFFGRRGRAASERGEGTFIPTLPWWVLRIPMRALEEIGTHLASAVASPPRRACSGANTLPVESIPGAATAVQAGDFRWPPMAGATEQEAAWTSSRQPQHAFRASLERIIPVHVHATATVKAACSDPLIVEVGGSWMRW